MTANIKEIPAQEIGNLDFGALDADDLAALSERVKSATVEDMRSFVLWVWRELRWLEQRISAPN